jgi:hypothetical protein
VEWYKRENEDLKTGRNKAIDECDKATDAYASFCEEHEALRDLRDANELTISNLRGQIEQLQSQESFRTALLESVVSAARVTLAEYKDYDIRSADIIRSFDPLAESLRSLDHWQEEATRAMLSDAAEDMSAPPNMPSFAYVHTQTVIENQKLKAIAEMAKKYITDPCGENFHALEQLTGVSESADAPNPDENLEDYESAKQEIRAALANASSDVTP